MARILILGAGVMGSALCVPAADNGHQVLLVGTPLDRSIIETLKRPGGIHPKLDAPLPELVEPLDIDALSAHHFQQADHIVVAVSSPGIGWASSILASMLTGPRPVAFVTKGLDAKGGGCRTYAESIPQALPVLTRKGFIGIGGPCIARELAGRWPTASIYACSDPVQARALAAAMQTDYYRLAVSDDVTGVEACAALKNFFAIGVSAMQTRYHAGADKSGHAKNPLAAAFTQAVREMTALSIWLGGRRETALDLAGLGDLHVTVGGGRNSRLGHGLGQGRKLTQIMAGSLAGETVEGIDTGRSLARRLRAACAVGDLSLEQFPLALAILDTIENDAPFAFTPA